MATIGKRVRRNVQDANNHGLLERQVAAPDRPLARRLSARGQELAKGGSETRQLLRRPIVACQRRDTARGTRHQRPPLAGQHVGTGLRAPVHERFALGLGDVVDENDERLDAGGREPRRLCFPPACRERRADRFRCVRGERGDLHSARYDARSALTMLRRAARAAGRTPPTMPMTTAQISARVTTPGDNAKPHPISEKLPKLSVETRANESSEASPNPAAPPASASTIDSARNAARMLRRWNPRARIVPTSTIRFATAAYIVIIQPIIAPMLKMMVTTRPRILMNFAIASDCSR